MLQFLFLLDHFWNFLVRSAKTSSSDPSSWSSTEGSSTSDSTTSAFRALEDLKVDGRATDFNFLRSIAPPLVPGGTTVVHLLPSHLLIYHL
ncbi:hypothetical protein QL285_070228 [Trifolium repens]|nr:hypothetical protein QL285_070228 [Trifolium repens]